MAISLAMNVSSMVPESIRVQYVELIGYVWELRQLVIARSGIDDADMQKYVAPKGRSMSQ